MEDDILVAPDNYPSKGSGERGVFSATAKATCSASGRRRADVSASLLRKVLTPTTSNGTAELARALNVREYQPWGGRHTEL
jgi:hypothetical protein